MTAEARPRAPSRQPTMFVLAGPNGAGKSTLHQVILAPRLGPRVPFVNADEIQKAELEDRSMQAAYRAAAIAEQRRRELIGKRRSFVTESTFSHPSKLALVDDALREGWRVVIHHVGVREAALSVERVASRVQHGGHDVPLDKIVERFERSQPLIRDAVLRAHRGYVWDNSLLGRAPRLQLEFRMGQLAWVGPEVEAWAAALYRGELERHVSRERAQPTQSSLAEAGSLGTRLAGRNVRMERPNDATPFYQGPIVGETSRHWLQQHDATRFTAHEKQHLVGDEPKLGRGVRIVYLEATRAIVEPFDGYPVRDTDTAKGKARREAFHTMTRDEALERHPELTQAYTALDGLLGRAAGDERLEPAQAKRLEMLARDRIGDALARGEGVGQAPSRRSRRLT
jgi:predicted ABC-type ATPase